MHQYHWPTYFSFFHTRLTLEVYLVTLSNFACWHLERGVRSRVLQIWHPSSYPVLWFSYCTSVITELIIPLKSVWAKFNCMAWKWWDLTDENLDVGWINRLELDAEEMKVTATTITTTMFTTTTSPTISRMRFRFADDFKRRIFRKDFDEISSKQNYAEFMLSIVEEHGFARSCRGVGSVTPLMTLEWKGYL